MAILKGDWVITDGEVGQVTMLNYNKGYHLVRVPSLPFASLRSEKGMTLLPEGLNPILSDSINKEK